MILCFFVQELKLYVYYVTLLIHIRNSKISTNFLTYTVIYITVK